MSDAAETERRIREALDGAGPAELRQFLFSLQRMAPELQRPRRPELRRPRLATPSRYRLRVDLKGAKPPVWRRLEVRSDIYLDTFHQVLQASFGWYDSHLHRFSLGGDPFARDSQLFLCPWDLEEADPADEGALGAAEIRLDEVLQERGDRLDYIYDYGDSWELVIILEAVLADSDGAAPVLAVDGRRAAPPEDCGGMPGFEDLINGDSEREGPPFDPEHFDLEEINVELRGGVAALAAAGVDRRLCELVGRLSFSPVADDLRARAAALIESPPALHPDSLNRALAPVRWFLQRAAADGIALTAAGYMRPDDVVAACAVLPAMAQWIGKNNREANSGPLIGFRSALQRVGLLSKRKDRLMLTRRGRAGLGSDEALFARLAERLVPERPEFDQIATLLLLLYVAGSADAELPRESIAAALGALGFRDEFDEPPSPYSIYGLTAFELLMSLGEPEGPGSVRARVSPTAAALARAALISA